jgi:PAS domain S-box-containing protein
MIRLIGITADVTAPRQAEAAVRENEAQLRFALDLAEIGIWQMDAVSGAMTWSDIQYQLFGIDPDTVSATPGGPSRNGFEALVDPEDREILHDRIEEALRSGQTFKLDFRINHPPDGHVRWLALRCGVQRDSEGVPERLIGVSWDITGRKMAEVILRDSNSGLEARVAERTHALTHASRELSAEIRRREEAQAMLMQSQNLQALGLVVDGMSHEFNNILATIQSSYNLLRRRITVADQTAVIDLAEPAVTRATKLIQHLQAMARHGPAQPLLVDLATALADSADLMRHTLGSRGRCRFDVEVGLWPAILDPIRLTALLVTLAVNMRDTMPDGAELEVAACNRASDGGASSGEWIVISVKDTASADGMSNTGAPENVLTPKARQSGIGLCLTAAHSFTAQAGGRLLVRSAPEVGTSIEIHLPRAVMTGPVNEPRKDPELAALSGGATILLVDDDENFRLLTAHLLRDLGYSVIEAPNTEVAIPLAHIAEQLDLVVSDIRMPGEGGPTLWRRLRLDRPALPILFISGSENAAMADGEQVLRKPFSGTQLAEAVLERLGRLTNSAIPAQTSVPVFDKLRDSLRNPRLRSVYDYWRSRRDPSGNLPDYSLFRIDGTDMTDNSFIVEVIGGRHTVGFRFVQIGQILEQRLGRSLVGELVDDVGDELGSAGASYRRCLETASPSYEYAHYSLADETPLLFERLLLPLSDDGIRVTHLLGIVIFTDLPDVTGQWS